MTNAEKYLKDGMQWKDLLKEFNYYFTHSGETDADSAFKNFMERKVVPKITETERTILNAVNKELYQVVGRDKQNDLYLDDSDNIFTAYITTIYGHLFQFIKAGEEYKIEELIKR